MDTSKKKSPQARSRGGAEETAGSGERKVEEAPRSAPEAKGSAPGPSARRRLLQNVGALASEHPAATLAVAVGASALLGAEVAAGALIGVGATLLLSKKSGAETRDDIKRRAKEVITGGAEL